MDLDTIIFIIVFIAASFIVYWFLKKILKVIIFAIAMFIAYILLKIFIIK